MHVLIIGTGQAAVQTVHTLRQNGFEGRITLVGEERHLPYQRPPLSKKYFTGELPRERLALRPAEYYRDRNVDLRLGKRAAGLEPAARRVSLEDGSAVDYDGLVLATGSRPRRPPVSGAELAGVHCLRTVDDADAIVAELEPGARLVLVGAGYIGLEVAASAVKRGADVTVVEAGDRVMSRVVCPVVSSFYDRRHREAGVELCYGKSVSRFVGSARVEAVETSDGERYPCDLAVIGIGVEPVTELAQAAGLACDDGILVDAYGRTADPNIVAAGDCTRHPHPLGEGPVRLESVQNAIEQAKAAASNFAGPQRAHTEVPWFWSDQYDVKLQIAGLSHASDEIAVRGDPDGDSFAAFYLRDGRLAAVDAVNDPKAYMFARKAIGTGLKVTAGAVADPRTDLAALLPE